MEGGGHMCEISYWELSTCFNFHRRNLENKIPRGFSLYYFFNLSYIFVLNALGMIICLFYMKLVHDNFFVLHEIGARLSGYFE